jgi:hypothetical protein
LVDAHGNQSWSMCDKNQVVANYFIISYFSCIHLEPVISVTDFRLGVEQAIAETRSLSLANHNME